MLTLGVADDEGEVLGVGRGAGDVARGEAARGGLAGLREERLDDGVVRAGGVEDEGDRVVDVRGDRVGVEGEGRAAGATDVDLREVVLRWSAT